MGCLSRFSVPARRDSPASIATIRLPPLREHGSDLRLLTELFLARATETAGRPLPTLHEGAWEKLRAYSWPGNIRQLQYVIHTAGADRFIRLSD